MRDFDMQEATSSALPSGLNTIKQYIIPGQRVLPVITASLADGRLRRLRPVGKGQAREEKRGPVGRFAKALFQYAVVEAVRGPQ